MILLFLERHESSSMLFLDQHTPQHKPQKVRSIALANEPTILQQLAIALALPRVARLVSPRLWSKVLQNLNFSRHKKTYPLAHSHQTPQKINKPTSRAVFASFALRVFAQ